MARSSKPKPEQPTVAPGPLVGAAHATVAMSADEAEQRGRELEAVRERLKIAAQWAQECRDEMQAWVRREIALAAAGVSEAERSELNP